MPHAEDKLDGAAPAMHDRCVHLPIQAWTWTAHLVQAVPVGAARLQQVVEHQGVPLAGPHRQPPARALAVRRIPLALRPAAPTLSCRAGGGQHQTQIMLHLLSPYVDHHLSAMHAIPRSTTQHQHRAVTASGKQASTFIVPLHVSADSPPMASSLLEGITQLIIHCAATAAVSR